MRAEGDQKTPGLLTKTILFASSYAPLMLLLIVRDSFKNQIWNMALAAACVVSLIGLYAFLTFSHRLAAHPLTLKRVDPRNDEALAYIVTYLVPFIGVDVESARNAWSLVILLVLIGFLYVNSNMIHVNPILNLLRYKTFEVESTDGKVSVLITRRNYIAPNQAITAISLSDYILMEAGS